MKARVDCQHECGNKGDYQRARDCVGMCGTEFDLPCGGWSSSKDGASGEYFTFDQKHYHPPAWAPIVHKPEETGPFWPSDEKHIARALCVRDPED